MRIILALLLIPFLNLNAQEASRLRLVFAGDIMGHDTQIESAKMMGEGSYDYSSCFKQIEDYISGADIAIGNLEVTLAGPPFKGYPAFSSPDELAFELKKCGFDVLVNANNHAIDRGKKGLERTLLMLDSVALIQTGVFKDQADRYQRHPLILEKNGIRIAILNYTYGTNGIKVSAPNIVNYIDPDLIKQDIQKAFLAAPDFVIAMMHWGLEYERTENKQQKEMAKLLIDSGVDAIIGSHPHVVQPIRLLDQNHLVVYSMGNMISNQRKRYTDGGILVDMTLEKLDSTRVLDYNYLPVWVHKARAKSGLSFQLLPANIDSSYHSSLNVTDDDAKKMKEFLEDTRGNLEGVSESDWKYIYKPID